MLPACLFGPGLLTIFPAMVPLALVKPVDPSQNYVSNA